MSEAIICEKAGHINDNLLQQTTGTCTDEASGKPFKTSQNYKNRTGVHFFIRHCEAANADMKAADGYLKIFARIIANEGYILNTFSTMTRQEFLEEDSKWGSV